MKKALTLLLCVAVVFTFSFSSAFGLVTQSSDTTYTKSEWSDSLTAKLAEISDNLEGTYKTTVLNSFTFNNEGYVKYNSSSSKFEKQDKNIVAGYTKDVLSEVLDDIIDSMEDKMEANKDMFLNAIGDTTTLENTADRVLKVLNGEFDTSETKKSYTDYAVGATETGLKAALEDMTYDVDGWNTTEGDGSEDDDVTVAQKLAEYQLDVTYSYIVDKKLNINLGNYDDEDKDWYYTAPTNKGTAVGKYNTEGKLDPAGTQAEVKASTVIGTVTKSSTDDSVTAAEAMDKLISDAKDALKVAKNAKYKTDAQQLKAYEDIYYAWDEAANDGSTGIPDKDDTSFADASSDTTTEDAIAAYAKHGYEQAAALVNGTWSSSDTRDWSGYVKESDDKLYNFWEPTSKTATTSSKDGELFGVKIADINKVTRTEGMAVYNAMKDEITKSKDVIAKWIDEAGYKTTTTPTSISQIADLYNTKTDWEIGSTDKCPKDETFLATLDRAMDLQDKYEDVVALGDKLKARTLSGVKQFDDAKVEEAVKNAEGKTYKFVGDTSYNNDTMKEETLLNLAMQDIYDNSLDYDKNLTNLKTDSAKQGLENLDKAIDDAIALMWDKTVNNRNHVTAYSPAKIVKTGTDKTPDDELVYKLDTYAGSEESDWYDIANDALDDLLEAQSYDDVEKIVAQAKADFSELLTEANESDVLKARDAYKDALVGYIEQDYQLLDSKSDYSKAYNGGDADNCDLYTLGCDVLDSANTVDAVKSAYKDAQKIVDNAKSNDELKALRNAAQKLINALPAEDKLTADDLTAVQEAYAAVKAYKDEAGSGTVSGEETLRNKYQKVIDKYIEKIDDEAEALWDKMDAVNTSSDADLAKYAAYKEEAQALVDKYNDLSDAVDDVNDTIGGVLHSAGYLPAYSATDSNGTYYWILSCANAGDDYANVKAAVEKSRDVVDNATNSVIWRAEVSNAKRLLVAANKPGAKASDIKAALDAYNALTQRQQLTIDEDPYYFNLVNAVMNSDVAAVQEIKIIAKSVAKKGKMTVSWKIKSGDTSNIDGYEIWKSTKHSKGYKKLGTTTKKTYTNKKGLKKGTRYYYKVRAYKVIDGTKYTSDWSNKARRIAK